jgi:microcompartment protein CcmK/EutM
VFLARVIGEVVATVKHAALHGQKILIIEKVSPWDKRPGETLLAIDSVDAGVGDTVLVVDEGSSAALIVGLTDPPIRTVIAGVIDQVEVVE